MPNDTLTALLLDPFLTFGEAEKEFGAMPASAREMKPVSLKPQRRSVARRVTSSTRSTERELVVRLFPTTPGQN